MRPLLGETEHVQAGFGLELRKIGQFAEMPDILRLSPDLRRLFGVDIAFVHVAVALFAAAPLIFGLAAIVCAKIGPEPVLGRFCGLFAIFLFVGPNTTVVSPRRKRRLFTGSSSQFRAAPYLKAASSDTGAFAPWSLP